MRKTIAMHTEKDKKTKDKNSAPDGAVPAYLLDREGANRAKVQFLVLIG